MPAAGVYQDPQQRLASLFASYGASGSSGGYLYRIVGGFAQAHFFPEKDTLDMTVTATDGKTLDISVPWTTRYGGGFKWTSGQDL